jgi:hypothetical protein
MGQMGLPVSKSTSPCRSLCNGLRKVLAVLVLRMLCPHANFAQTWTTETVDTSGTYSSIAVDASQNVHISYFAGVVKYAFRPAGSGRWFTMDIAPGGGYSELFTRIALDTNGNPHMCFTPGVLKYAFFDDKNKKWNVQQIDPQAGLIDYSCSLAIAPDGTPHVLWYQYGTPGGGYFLHVRYAVLENGAWLARTVDFEGQTGKWNSLVLDAQGKPHLAYDSFLVGEMKYAYWTGKEWQISVVNSGGGGMGNSMILNRDGKALISFEHDDALLYAWQTATSWKVETIDRIATSGSWTGFRTRQALDLDGNPHIVYEDGGAVKHAFWNGSAWNMQVVSGAGIRPHRFEDIAIDRLGTIYISYLDAVDGSLKVAIGRRQVSPPPPPEAENKKP